MLRFLAISVVTLQTAIMVRGYPGSFCSGKSNGNYPDPANCNGYIACSNGITYRMPCPSGLVWNANRKYCDWKHNVSPPCGTYIPTSTPSSYTTPSTATPSTPSGCQGRANGNYPDPNNCRGYIACSNGYTYHMPCPAELKWNNAKKICDWPRNANPRCGASSKSPPSYSCRGPTMSSSTCSNGRRNGNYPDPNNCHGYIACSNGLTYHMPCPASLKWNDRRKICDWPRNAYPACSGATPVPPTTSSSSGGGGHFCNGKANGNYPDPGNCYGYIACSNSITYHMPCPAKLKWNDNKKRCDGPQYASPGCSGAQLSPSFVCVCPNGNSSSNFCSGKSNGNYPDPANCNGYIACSNGITYRMPCPSGLVWNANRKYCDWKHNVSPPCGTYTQTSTLSSYTTLSTATPSTPSCSDILTGQCCSVVKARNDCRGVVGLYCRRTCNRC